MKSSHVFFLSRLLMAVLFLVAGLRKAANYAVMLGYFGSLGMPFPAIVLPVTLVVEIGGGLALVAGWKPRWIAPVLALFTLATALMAHQFWSAPAQMVDIQLYNFFKNIAIAGGLLLVAAWPRRED